MVNNARGNISIRRLAVTGPEKATVDVKFSSGLNIIWGSSNTGKSFILKAIDFMLGSDTLDLPIEGKGFDTAQLWMTLPDMSDITVQRSVFGGDMMKVGGHLDEINADLVGVEKLISSARGKSESISSLLLREAGFDDAQLVLNERGKKTSLSLRTLARYLLIREDRMIDEGSLLLGSQNNLTALEKSLFKFLITGIDCSSIIPVKSADQLKASRDGKVELLKEMIKKFEGQLHPDFNIDDQEQALGVAEEELETLQESLNEQQAIIDSVRMDKRSKNLELETEQERVADLRAMVVRFSELEKVYCSDLDRLLALEEGGFLLGKFAAFECPLCGADPEHQNHTHSLADIEVQGKAVAAEIAKTEGELMSLRHELQRIFEDIKDGSKHLEVLKKQNNLIEMRLVETLPYEQTSRTRFNEGLERVSGFKQKIRIFEQIKELEQQVVQFEQLKLSTKQKAENLNLDLTADEAGSFSKVVKSVLAEWGYPGLDNVHFDLKDYDIVVDGKQRRGNGKGIRAILHCAFKVALLLYCRENSLPHPGFIVMDSPLLAYRGPIGVKRYGELSNDEKEVKKTELNSRFYNHLHSLSDYSQFIVLENETPPADISPDITQVQFTGNPEFGRVGFFNV